MLRADFMLFCDFDYHDIPDHSALSLVRNWLNSIHVMPKLINQQLKNQNLKIINSSSAILDATKKYFTTF